MKNLTIISILIISCMLSSCIKDKEDEDELITFTGKILEFCDGAPLANTDLIIWQSEQAFLGNGGLLTYSAHTDANGNFSFVVEDGHQIQIRVGGRAIISRLPVRSDLSNLGTFYANPTTSFVYRIKVNNPYQVGDTLLLNLRGKQDKIPAPLNDSIFSAVPNHSPLATQSYPIDGKIPIPGNFAVFRGPSNIPNANRLVFEKFTFNLPECNKIDTITIEIN